MQANLPRLIRVAPVILCSPWWGPSVHAQDGQPFYYPSKPVRVIVAVAPGGGVDIQARLFSQKLSEQFGRSFVVENRPSAGGADAFGLVARGAPDGHLLLAVNSSFTVPRAFARNLPDPIRDFTPVALLSRAPFLLVVHPSVPARSVRDFIALARAQPGKLNFAGPPSGTSSHLGAIWFFSLARIQVSYVPYKGTGPAQIALIGGETEATMASIVSVGSHLKAGRLRALGVTTTQRFRMMPELPTVAEQGAPGYEYITFFGLVAPPATPAGIVSRLGGELSRIVAMPDVENKFREEGAETLRATPEQFAQFIASEVQRWNKVVQTTGIKIDQ